MEPIARLLICGNCQNRLELVNTFCRFDLDGFNDVYVTNGIYRDVVDRDINNQINEQINKNKRT